MAPSSDSPALCWVRRSYSRLAGVPHGSAGCALSICAVVIWCVVRIDRVVRPITRLEFYATVFVSKGVGSFAT